ncbi:hypothetical protein ON010_g404 [Phytophthora cinnamomi]|nr:hypothetical protein ON010_g404 [Phytophthora cinnamomi]
MLLIPDSSRPDSAHASSTPDPDHGRSVPDRRLPRVVAVVCVAGATDDEALQDQERQGHQPLVPDLVRGGARHDRRLRVRPVALARVHPGHYRAVRGAGGV